MINLNKKKITLICQQIGISRLYLVGSSARDDYNSDSDVDFLICFDTIGGLDQYFDAKEAFEKELGKKVDLIEEKAVKNSIIKKGMELDRMLIYEA